MWWEERQAEGEVGAREDGEGLDEDVGDGLVAGEVGVELVAAVSWSVLSNGDTGRIIVTKWKAVR